MFSENRILVNFLIFYIMNKKKLIILVFLTLSSFKAPIDLNDTILEVEAQEGLIVYATYDGKEDYGYNFITKDRDGEAQTLTFHKVDDGVLTAFDLNAETFVGTKFKITFNRDLKLSKDEDGMDDEDETNTITKLEKL